MCFSYPTSHPNVSLSYANTNVYGTAVQTIIVTIWLKLKMEVLKEQNHSFSFFFLTCTISALWFIGNPLGNSIGTSEQGWGLGVTTFTQ